MNAFLWVVSALLAATYIASGGGKVVASRERLLSLPGFGWVEETPMPRVRLIGTLEMAGAVGVVVPWASGILPILTPLAALGLAAVQVGALWTHASRGEHEHLWLNVALLIAALVVAVGRGIG